MSSSSLMSDYTQAAVAPINLRGSRYIERRRRATRGHLAYPICCYADTGTMQGMGSIDQHMWQEMHIQSQRCYEGLSPFAMLHHSRYVRLLIDRGEEQYPNPMDFHIQLFDVGAKCYWHLVSIVFSRHHGRTDDHFLSLQERNPITINAQAFRMYGIANLAEALNWADLHGDYTVMEEILRLIDELSKNGIPELLEAGSRPVVRERVEPPTGPPQDRREAQVRQIQQRQEINEQLDGPDPPHIALGRWSEPENVDPEVPEFYTGDDDEYDFNDGNTAMSNAAKAFIDQLSRAYDVLETQRFQKDYPDKAIEAWVEDPNDPESAASRLKYQLADYVALNLPQRLFEDFLRSRPDGSINTPFVVRVREIYREDNRTATMWRRHRDEAAARTMIPDYVDTDDHDDLSRHNLYHHRPEGSVRAMVLQNEQSRTPLTREQVYAHVMGRPHTRGENLYARYREMPWRLAGQDKGQERIGWKHQRDMDLQRLRGLRNLR